MKMALWQVPETATDASSTDAPDTPLTDVLLDQFSAYYILAVLAVRALEEARRQRVLADAGTARQSTSAANST